MHTGRQFRRRGTFNGEIKRGVITIGKEGREIRNGDSGGHGGKMPRMGKSDDRIA